MSDRYPYAGEYDHLPIYGAIQIKSERGGKASTGKSAATAKPVASSAKPFAGMSTTTILAGLTVPQIVGLTAALGASPAKVGTAKSDAEYQRGVANGRAAERIRIGKVHDMAKTCGGDAEALRLLATSHLDSTAILAKLYGEDKSLVDNMKARHGLGGDA